MEKAYAEAIYNTLVRGESETKVFDALNAHLKKAGRVKLLPRILHELKNLRVRKESQGAIVEVAANTDKKAALKEAAAFGVVATEAIENDTLISGWRARKGGVLIDRSGKRALVDLYRRITN